MAELHGAQEESERSKKEKDALQAELQKARWVAVEPGEAVAIRKTCCELDMFKRAL